jgi:hypothetical protein
VDCRDWGEDGPKFEARNQKCDPSSLRFDATSPPSVKQVRRDKSVFAQAASTRQEEIRNPKSESGNRSFVLRLKFWSASVDSVSSYSNQFLHFVHFRGQSCHFSLRSLRSLR